MKYKFLLFALLSLFLIQGCQKEDLGITLEKQWSHAVDGYDGGYINVLDFTRPGRIIFGHIFPTQSPVCVADGGIRFSVDIEYNEDGRSGRFNYDGYWIDFTDLTVNSVKIGSHKYVSSAYPIHIYGPYK